MYDSLILVHWQRWFNDALRHHSDGLSYALEMRRLLLQCAGGTNADMAARAQRCDAVLKVCSHCLVLPLLSNQGPLLLHGSPSSRPGLVPQI